MKKDRKNIPGESLRVKIERVGNSVPYINKKSIQRDSESVPLRNQVKVLDISGNVYIRKSYQMPYQRPIGR